MTELNTAAAGHHFPDAIHDQAITVAAPVCVLSDRDGQIRPTGVTGIFVSDLRVLRRAELVPSVGHMVHLGSSASGPTATFDAVLLGAGDDSPDPTVRIRRERTTTTDGVDETIRISSTAVTPVRLTLSLVIMPELTPLAEIRGGAIGAEVAYGRNGDGLHWTGDGMAVSVAGDGDIVGDTLRWSIALEAGTSQTLSWRLRATDKRSWTIVPRDPAPWSTPSVDARDPRLGWLLEHALADLDALRMADAATPDGQFIGAGVPWYLTLFGRDSLWTARMLLPLGTGLAEGTLRTLAGRQGRRVDAAACEEPGKIMHELRRNQIFGVSSDPDALEVYYGTVDATMLWISLLADAWRWGLPDATVAALLPHMTRGLEWLDRFRGDLVSYVDTTGRGLANQGWKDSGTSVRFHDGRIAEPPIALCEVQGYAHRAALDAAELMDAFGLDGSDRWRDYATTLASQFRDRFWVDGPSGPQPALALDRHGRPVDSLTSNIGHLIGTGMLSAAEETTVARLLGAPPLAGGFGLRTMSSLDAAFDPLSYHCGSIWPHDTAIALLGLSSMRGDADARTTAALLIDGLLTAAEGFDYRLPELYAGDDRSSVQRPLPHPAACRPQAWSAAAAVAVLQAALGLSAGPLSAAPLAMGAMTVRGLQHGGAPLDITVDRDGRVRLEGVPAVPAQRSGSRVESG